MEHKTHRTTPVAQRYAKALNQVLNTHSERELSSQWFDALETIMETDPRIDKILKAPTVTQSDKLDVITSSVMLPAKIEDTMRAFLSLLAQNRRLDEVRQIGKAYRARLLAESGQIEGHVVCAFPAAEAIKEHISRTFSARLGCPVVLTYSDDQALIGGFTATIGGRFYDGSVLGRLKRIEQGLIDSLVGAS